MIFFVKGKKHCGPCSNETLYRLDIDKHVVEKMIPNDSTYLGLFTFCLDDSGNNWIGIIGNGLIKFDTNTSRFISLKDVLQQSVYSIYSICYDDGNIWMGTDDGLYCYNIVGNRLMSLIKEKIHKGKFIYPLACMKGMDGLILLAGQMVLPLLTQKDFL